MSASIQRHPGSDTAQRPCPGAGIGNAWCDPVAQQHFVIRIEMLESGGKPDHFIQAFRLDPFQLWLLFRRFRYQTALEVGLQVIPDFGMTGFTHAAGHATPHDPVFDPDRFLTMNRKALREQLSGLLGSPFIERITEARTQCVSRELKPNPLVVSGSTTPAG